MAKSVEIEKVANGYIVTYEGGMKEVYRVVDEVFKELLGAFESRSEDFHGNLYGKVTVDRKETKT